MELDDCAFPLLHDTILTSKPEKAFDGAAWVLLVGAVPRKQGMERSDLLNVNAGIFGPQGKAIAASAATDVRILVVGNPCNTNCLIARSNAPEILPERWFAMMRLDENRAKTLLARKAGVPVGVVRNMGVWGNHSTTQYPDARNANIAGLSPFDVIKDHGWLKGKFIETVQKRGAAVIEARGSSSAASAANAVIDSVNSIWNPTPWGEWHSVAVVSHGEYGIPEGLQFGFPVRTDGRTWEVVTDLQHDGDAKDRIRKTTEELIQERDMVKALLPA
jgi:malate dehydrogenase